MEAISRILQQAALYPFSTGAHIVIMGLAGGMLIQSHRTGGVMLRTFSIMLALLWITYEGLEFAQLHDNVAADISTGIVAYVVGALLVSAYHYGKRKWRAH